MRRREFITVLGGAAAWPVAARAQQPAKVSRIGFVAGGARPPSLESSLYAGFAQGMRELGYIEGKHFIIDYRFAEGQYERFRAIADEFARLRVDIIVAGASFAVPAMREANPSTPIVMGYSIDPVGQGLVASLAQPGGSSEASGFAARGSAKSAPTRGFVQSCQLRVCPVLQDHRSHGAAGRYRPAANSGK